LIVNVSSSMVALSKHVQLFNNRMDLGDPVVDVDSILEHLYGFIKYEYKRK
jgi:hypothetical protein